MKSEKKELLIAKRYLVVLIAALALSILSGCQEQIAPAAATVKIYDYQNPVNEPTPKTIPAQLAAKVILNDDGHDEISTEHNNVKLPIYKTMLMPKYSNASAYNLELNNDSWKDAYDGVGVPLLKISF